MLVYEKRTPKCNFINLLDLFNIKRKHFGTLSVNDFQTCDNINIMIKPSFEIPLFKAQWVRCIVVYSIKESWWLNIFFRYDLFAYELLFNDEEKSIYFGFEN